MSTTTLLLKEIGARLTGDSAKAKSAKVGRKCVSKVNLQISSLENRKIELEDELDDAKIALKDSKFPTISPSKGNSYTDGISSAYNVVQEAKEKLEEVLESLEFFKTLINEFDTKVVDKVEKE